LGAGTLIIVYTSALTQPTSSSTVTLTFNTTTYTLLTNSAQGPTAGTINLNTQTLILSLGTTTATILNMSTAFDTTIVQGTSFPFPYGVNTGTGGFCTNTSACTNTGYIDDHNAQIRLPESAVGSLPSATANSGKEFIVTDGATATDCTTGSGTSIVNMCRSNGSIWVFIGATVGGSTSSHYTWFPAAGNNDGSGQLPTGLWSIPGGSAAAFTNNSGGNVAQIGSQPQVGLANFVPTGSSTSTFVIQYVLADTSTTNLSLRLFHSVINSAGGSQTYVIYVSFACATLGTTSMASISFGSPVWTITQTMTDTLANANKGFYSLSGSLSTGCSTGQAVFIQLKRTPGVGSDTSTDYVVSPGMQVIEIY
jgi:hypothetical protein